ncbi:hypothetical protein ACFFLZ_14910 [Photobacterium aphoticum]|nr:hypothetical protein [Photobacterium aphoticum]GHA55958.1 hypothetical protein GCM10007086_32450 [Photobacterium aphoticum]
MFSKAITAIGICVIGGKYLLMLILAAITLSTGSLQADLIQLAAAE